MCGKIQILSISVVESPREARQQAAAEAAKGPAGKGQWKN